MIKVYEAEQNGREIRKLGTKEIDLAEYASKGELKLEVELDPEKKLDNPVLVFRLFLDRQDDDSK